MTREQAINYLKSSGMTEEQIETVINALTCEDCISRQALLEKAIIVPIAKVVTEDKVICRKIVFVEDIQKLPSVTPRQKIGHWIEEEVFDGEVAYRCSECGELFWLESGTPKDNEYNFCPNCGARMESEKQALAYADQDTLMPAT